MSEDTNPVPLSYKVLKEFGDHHIGEVVSPEEGGLTPEECEGLVIDGTLETIEVVSNEAKPGDACTTEDGLEGTVSEDFVCVSNDTSVRLPESPTPNQSSNNLPPEVGGAEPVNGSRHHLA